MQQAGEALSSAPAKAAMAVVTGGKSLAVGTGLRFLARRLLSNPQEAAAVAGMLRTAALESPAIAQKLGVTNPAMLGNLSNEELAARHARLLSTDPEYRAAAGEE